jgi:small subunit ribosomal protein S16
MKKLGRKHRPFFRICAMDQRAPRDGRVIEELGYYDPMVKETDARAVLKNERVDYWLSVGAKPSDKVATLIKKYGSSGTHIEQQQAAFDRLAVRPQAPEAVAIPLPSKETPAEPPAEEAPAATEEAPAATEEAAAPVEEAAAPTEEAAAPTEEAAAPAAEAAEAVAPQAEEGSSEAGGEEAKPE